MAAFCAEKQELTGWQEAEYKVDIKNCILVTEPKGTCGYRDKPKPRGTGVYRDKHNRCTTVESLGAQKPTQSNIRTPYSGVQTTNQSRSYRAKPFSGVLALINSSLTKYVASLHQNTKPTNNISSLVHIYVGFYQLLLKLFLVQQTKNKFQWWFDMLMISAYMNIMPTLAVSAY